MCKKNYVQAFLISKTEMEWIFMLVAIPTVRKYDEGENKEEESCHKKINNTKTPRNGLSWDTTGEGARKWILAVPSTLTVQMGKAYRLQ